LGRKREDVMERGRAIVRQTDRDGQLFANTYCKKRLD
jgi:hypothetical protein